MPVFQGQLNIKIWVLLIEHEYGKDLTLYATEDLAWIELKRYVKDWWEHDFMSILGKCPKRLTEVEVNKYFATTHDSGKPEYYLLEAQEIIK